MQIDEGLLVKFFSYVFGGFTTLLGTLYWYIWKGDRRRLKVLEEKMASAVTLPQVNEIVDRVETHFREEHKGLDVRMQRAEDRLSVAIKNSHDSLQASIEPLQDSIQAIHNALTKPYRGADRRRQ